MSRLEPHHVAGLLQALVPCNLSADELSRRVEAALREFIFADLQAYVLRQPAEVAKHRNELELAATKLMSLLASDRTLAALWGADVPGVSSAKSIGNAISAAEEIAVLAVSARKRALKVNRGGVQDKALDELLRAVTSIYSDATGERPASSRNVLGVVSGPWLDFWTQAISIDMFGYGCGVFLWHPPTLDAIDKRARRLGLVGQGSSKRSNDGNTSHASKRDNLIASKPGGADAKNDGRARRRDRTGGRARA